MKNSIIVILTILLIFSIFFPIKKETRLAEWNEFEQGYQWGWQEAHKNGVKTKWVERYAVNIDCKNVSNSTFYLETKGDAIPSVFFNNKGDHAMNISDCDFTRTMPNLRIE